MPSGNQPRGRKFDGGGKNGGNGGKNGSDNNADGGPGANFNGCNNLDQCTSAMAALSSSLTTPPVTNPSSPALVNTNPLNTAPLNTAPLNNPDKGSTSATPIPPTAANVAPASEPPTATGSLNDVSPSLSLSTDPPSEPQSTSTVTKNPNSTIKPFSKESPETHSLFATSVSTATVPFGVDPSLVAKQSSGGDSAINTTTPTASPASKISNTGPIVGGILGSLAFILLIVLALLYIRRRQRRYRIAPSAEYLASQYPFTSSSEIQRFTDNEDGLISTREHDLRPNKPPFLS